MKQLLKILSAGLLLFIAAAIIQEQDYFRTAWFDPEPVSSGQDGSQESEAAGAVREALTLMSHLYTSAGDPRFADRMPVAGEVLEEIQADIGYLTRNRRVQEPRLQKLEIRSIQAFGDSRMEVGTREFWIHRTFWADGTGESDPPRSVILYPVYRLSRENTGWRIYGWDFPGSESE